MTKEQTLQIISRVKHLYQTQARRLTPADWETMTEAWYQQFANESFENVNKALTSYANRGRQFMPDVPDIIGELLNVNEPYYNKLFNRLKRECEMVANGTEHVVIDDLGGIVKDPTSPTGYRHKVAEAHMTTTYTQSDFANLPKELQVYADDIEGLKALHREIQSNEMFARKRFIDRMPYILQEIDA